jgi:hypothetical protein
MALTVEQIVAGLRISRGEFGRIFLQAQVDAVQNPADRASVDAVACSGVDQKAFAEALRWAQQNNYLDTIVRSVVAEGLENGSLPSQNRVAILLL